MKDYQSFATASGADVHFDIPLSNLAVSAFSDGTDDLIADQIFPMVAVGKQSDKYYTISREAFLRIPKTHRSPGTKAARVHFDVSSDSYFADNYALADEIPLEDLANADIAVGLRDNATRLVVGNLRRDQEVRIANLITSISNVGSGVQLTGTDKWGDSNSDPIAQVNTAHAFVRQNTGLIANTAIIDYDSMVVLRRHPLILDMFKYTSGGEATDSQLASVLKVDRILVGRGIKHNELEAVSPTASATNIWGNNLIIARVAAGTGLRTATLGLRMRWMPNVFPANMGVSRAVYNRAGEEKTEVIEAGYYQDEKVVATNLGYVIANTL